MDFNYSVPIIPQNLNKHETIVQIAEVLQHLSNITESIFNEVNIKIENSRSKLTLISNRVETVSQKIDQLRGAKKATQVFSSSRYPASEVCHDYTSIFYNSKPIILERHKVRTKNAYSAYEPLDKLQFYHVNISATDKENKFQETDDVINNAEFINDLFTNGKSKSNGVSTSNEFKGFLSITDESSIFSELGEAPPSISKRSRLTLTQNYFYAPKIGEVPALDVPLDLPDLPGIANDLYYNNEFGPIIAPSAAITRCLIDNVIDLPKVPENDETNEDNPVEYIPPTITLDLPKLPSLEEVQKPEENIPVKSEADPKISEVDAPLLPKASTSTLSKTKIPLISEARSSLMEAIRNAGGAKKATLRSVQSAKTESSSASKGGDFMADLHSKLFMRRKGISGIKKDVDAESTLVKISALIPPPEIKHDVESTSNEEEDWE